MSQVEEIRAAVAAVLQPGHFYTGPTVGLEWQHVLAEQTPWEVFRGQLIPSHLTRERATFESWNIYANQDGQRSDEPLLSFKLDVERGQVHVVRGIHCWTWEGYQEGANVFLSREVPRWQRELVGSVDWARCSQQELALWVFRAVVGLSRLPLTSVEAPLPSFSLGVVAYFWNPERESADSLRTWRDLQAHHNAAWPPLVQTKWLEFLLRATPAGEIDALATAPVAANHGDTLRQLRAVFNDVALSPHTDFVDKTLVFLRHLVQQRHLTIEQHVDFLSFVLRQLARHLTAYDLVTFHHRGANYPDALLLDFALKEYLRLIEAHEALFTGNDRAARRRRRGLRAGWLHRRRYEEHPVPDAPTSPGENLRILPPPHVRVPEEQISNLGKRKKRLFHDDPLDAYAGPKAQAILQRYTRLDLQSPEELYEVGIGLFVERPFGVGKAAGEPDLSPLLAHEAFSAQAAERALSELSKEPLLALPADEVGRWHALLDEPWHKGGIMASALPTQPPRVVALADAAKAAADFIILQTLPGSLREAGAWLNERGVKLDPRAALIVGNVSGAGQPVVWICNSEGRCLQEYQVDSA
jgi:hypothetical protein